MSVPFMGFVPVYSVDFVWGFSVVSVIIKGNVNNELCPIY